MQALENAGRRSWVKTYPLCPKAGMGKIRQFSGVGSIPRVWALNPKKPCLHHVTHRHPIYLNNHIGWMIANMSDHFALRWVVFAMISTARSRAASLPCRISEIAGVTIT
jgi:hypothetical protein